MYIRTGTTYGAVMLELLKQEDKLRYWKRLFFLSIIGVIVFVSVSVSYELVPCMLLCVLCIIGAIVSAVNISCSADDLQDCQSFMLSKLDLDRYEKLKEEVIENYHKPSKTAQKTSKTVIKTVRECNPDFLQSIKDFFILPLRDQEHIVSCLRGDEKPQTEIYKKMIQTFNQSGYSVKDVIGVLQTIKTKVF